MINSMFTEVVNISIGLRQQLIDIQELGLKQLGYTIRIIEVPNRRAKAITKMESGRWIHEYQCGTCFFSPHFKLRLNFGFRLHG